MSSFRSSGRLSKLIEMRSSTWLDVSDEDSRWLLMDKEENQEKWLFLSVSIWSPQSILIGF
jgi:hypothetical protein